MATTKGNLQAVPLLPGFIENVRSWRAIRAETIRLKSIVDPDSKEKVVARTESLTRKESDLRKTICEVLPNNCMMEVDGQPLVYSRSEQANPNDDRFEVGWQRLQEKFANDPKMLKIMASLLPDPKPRIVHKLS